MEEMAERLPTPSARIIGGVYLLYFVAAFAGLFLAKGIVVPGDSGATAAHILSHENLYRAAIAVGLIANVVYIALTALFYRFFGPVSWTLSLLAAFVSLVGCTVQIFAALLQLAPLVVLRDPHLMVAFTSQQLQAASLSSLSLYSLTFHISLVLFAFYDVLLGYLIVRARFLPRFLGILLMLAGVGWLTFVWPPLGTKLSPVVLPFGALAEILLMLWLLVRGAGISKRHEVA